MVDNVPTNHKVCICMGVCLFETGVRMCMCICQLTGISQFKFDAVSLVPGVPLFKLLKSLSTLFSSLCSSVFSLFLKRS